MMAALHNPMYWLAVLVGLTIYLPLFSRAWFGKWMRLDDALWVVTTLEMLVALAAVYVLRETLFVTIAAALLALYVVLLVGAFRRDSNGASGWRAVGFVLTMLVIIAVAFVIAAGVMQ